MRREFVRRWLRRLFAFAICCAFLFLIGALVFRWLSPPAPLAFAPTPESVRHPSIAAGVANYARPEQDTFYTCPEWYIVWSYQAKADYQRNHLPSGYPFFGDIGQYWKTYSRAYSFTRGRYPFAGGEHLMLVVIGSSFTLEYVLKGAYEKSVGRFFEKTAHGQLSLEDAYAAEVAADYASFVHVRPFYEYSFWTALRGLWGRIPFSRTHLLRSLERRAWLSVDYGIESLYCEILGLLTHLTYGYEDTRTAAWVDLTPESRPLLSSQRVEIVRESGNEALVQIPRYQAFTPAAIALVSTGMRFHQIAGNELVVVSAIVPTGRNANFAGARLLLAQPILSEPGAQRVFLLCRVPQLHELLQASHDPAMRLEHIYDY